MSSYDGPGSGDPNSEEERALRDLFAHAQPRLSPPAAVEAEIRRAVFAEWDAMTRRRVVVRRAGSAAVAAALVAGVALFMFDDGTAPASTVASVERLQGNVLVGGERVAVGAAIPGGAAIATRSGQIALRLARGGSLRLAPQTELTLSASTAAELDAGALYFDSEGGAPAEHLEVRTALGTVRDVGTQFEARLEGERLAVGVRDGRVALARDGETVEARPGERLTVARGAGAVRRDTIATFGSEWEWAERLAPPFDIDGKHPIEFLSWVAAQTGRELEFADPASERIARDTVLNGSIDLAPLPMLAAVLALTDLEHSVDDQRIVIRTK